MGGELCCMGGTVKRGLKRGLRARPPFTPLKVLSSLFCVLSSIAAEGDLGALCPLAVADRGGHAAVADRGGHAAVRARAAVCPAAVL